MAVIEWTPSAWQTYNDYLENARIEYGRKTALHWEGYMLHIYERLKLYPMSYTPEALLSDKKILYRSCLMMHRRFKLIYYYDESEDTVYLVDIWDTKMNPKALIKRIK